MQIHSVLEVTGQDPESLQSNLTAAVDRARATAMGLGRHGIMVTQHDFDFFTVRLSPEVPYGETWERRDFQKARTRGPVSGQPPSGLSTSITAPGRTVF